MVQHKQSFLVQNCLALYIIPMPLEILLGDLRQKIQECMGFTGKAKQTRELYSQSWAPVGGGEVKRGPSPPPPQEKKFEKM